MPLQILVVLLAGEVGRASLAPNLNYFFLSDGILFYASVTDPYTLGFFFFFFFGNHGRWQSGRRGGFSPCVLGYVQESVAFRCLNSTESTCEKEKKN